MLKALRIFAIFAISVLLAAALQPAIAQPANRRQLSFSAPEPSYITPVTASALTMLAQTRAVTNQQRESGLDVDALQAATPPGNQTDTDGDSLYDSVEWVLGTDFNNTDSDFDRLNDSEEVMIYFTDPLEPDSNNDGLADYFEVTNVSSLDLDGDGYSNAWDFDNDDDGVVDTLDLSPFSRSITSDRFHFDIKTNGSPSYLSFQLRPQDTNHLRLPVQTWDWPVDDEGAMKDVNRSTDDVSITPVLELTVPVYCKIVANHSSKYLEVQDNSTADGANVRQNSDTGLDNQLWKLDPIGDGYYKLVANHSGKCLEVQDNSTADGANVRQNSDTGLDNQLWKLDPVGGGYYKLVAKHSRKCLEVSSNSTADGANVQQYEYWDRNNQQWKFELVENVLSPQGDVEDYGITISLNKLFIPLSSSTDYGSPVALSGRMFFPASVPLNLSADAQLVWMVTGKTDRTGKKIALKAPNGNYVHAESGDGKELVANRGAIGDCETFEIVFVAENKVALKAHNGQYIGVDHEELRIPGAGWGVKIVYEWYPLVANRNTIGKKETFTLERTNDMIALKAHNGKYVCMECADSGYISLLPGLLTADSTNPVYFYQIQVAEVETERTVLARYKENFSLTGFRVEENYGYDAGLFYSDDMNQTLNAGFVMAFQFLRNTTTHISDMPTELDTYNVTGMKSTFGSFSHRDEALLNVTSVMKPAVLDELDNLSDDKTLPVIFLPSKIISRVS